MRVTILGCGTAGGVPRIGNDWGACDPREPRNRRRRASIRVEQGATSVLVDASPDLRQQALDAGMNRLDAVLFTHEHADHSHGFDDLRFFNRLIGRPVPVHADARTLAGLQDRFAYAFTAGGLYPQIVAGHEIDGPFRVGELAVTPFSQHHGPKLDTLGFRLGAFAYSTDVAEMPEAAFAVLAGIDTWVVDALQIRPHITHAHLEKTLSWIARVKPRRAILTHMGAELDYRTLSATLPAGVEPAYDGMVIAVPE